MLHRDFREEMDPREKKARFPESLRADGVAPDEQDAVWALLDEWKGGEPGAGFDEAVMARIRAEEQQQESRGLPGGSGIAAWFRGFGGWVRGLGPVRGFGLASALAMVLLAAVILRQPAPPTETPEGPGVSQELTAQQVEMALEDLQMLDELYNTPVPEENSNKKI
jgi:hypothetical protein